MDISGRGPRSFFFYTITVADWCSFHQGGYTHPICWPFISLSNGNNTKYCLLGLNPSKRHRNAHLEMQNNKRMKCRSIVKERRATEDMLPLTGLLLHYSDGVIIVPHRKPWAGGWFTQLPSHLQPAPCVTLCGWSRACEHVQVRTGQQSVA